MSVQEAVPLPVVELLRTGKELTAQLDANDPSQIAINW